MIDEFVELDDIEEDDEADEFNEELGSKVVP